MRRPIPYSDALESPAPDEAATFAAIIEAMTAQCARNADRHGCPHRPSHAKSHALLKGELHVLPGLPPELAQGLFAAPRSHPVLLRLANAPGEILADSVTTQRGMAIKVLDVPGGKLPGHEADTQDFVLDNGPRFASADAAGFLRTLRALNASSPAPDAAKAAVSRIARAANAVLDAAGAGSAALDFLGHRPRHPLADPYFTQAPIRYGAHVAKLGVFPASPGLAELPDIDAAGDADALRTATVAWFRRSPAEFEVRVQLCTDPARMPVEDASAEWPEAESPYRPVARIVVPAQDACSPPRRRHVDERLSFCPSHSLTAHRPLGSIMRARLAAYPAVSAWRGSRGGAPLAEPRSLAEIPD
jgi:hypothetical protein